MFPHPVSSRVASAVLDFAEGHKKTLVSTFNAKFVATTKAIKKGAAIKATDIEEAEQDPGALPAGVDHQLEVAGQIAARNLKSGQLVTVSDLVMKAVPTKLATKSVWEDDHSGGKTQWLDPVKAGPFAVAAAPGIAMLVLIGAALIALFVSQFLLIVHAFRTSVFWGLGFLFVPFVSTAFEYRYWNGARKPFTLSLVALFVLGLAMGFCAGQTTSRKLITLVTATQQVSDAGKDKILICYMTKDVKEGALITADCIDFRELEREKMPEDAVTTPAQAIGKVCLYEVQVGQILSVHDIGPAKRAQ